ncbi:MAG: TonB-dependent receptor [Bacteroidota bacterium]
MKRIFLFSLIGLLAGPVFSQYTLTDTTVITASRLAEPVQKSGRSVSIITAKEIRELPVTSFDELLRFVTGVEVQGRNGFGAQGDILIRGGTFTQTLILVDGMRMNDPLTGHFNNYLPVSLAEIARVEVLRGPAAAIYGPDAVGGVVHVITHTHLENKAPAAKNSLRAEVAAGEHDLGMISVGGYQNIRNSLLSAGYQLNQSNGEPLPGDLRNDFTLHTASLGFRTNFSNKLSFSLRGGYDHRDFNAQYFYTRSPLDLSRENTSSGWGQAQLMAKSKIGVTHVNSAVKIFRDEFVFNPAFPGNEHTTRLYNLQVTHHKELSNLISLLGGVQGDYRTVQSNDRGDHADGHLGAFFQANYSPVKALGITAALRGDYDQNYGFEVLPQLNIGYHTGRFAFRAASGRSIRAADFTERYIAQNLGTPEAPLSGGRNLGNPDLEAERSWSHELGVDVDITSFLTVSATGFLRQGSNLIDFVFTPASEIPNNERLVDTAAYFFTQNFAQSTTSGLEFALRGSHSFGAYTSLQFQAGYLFVDVRDGDGNRLSPDAKYLASSARHLVNGQFMFRTKYASISINGLWKERNAEAAPDINAVLNGAYQVINVRLSGHTPNQRYTGFVQVVNVFDEQYVDILGAPMPGRWIMGGVRFGIFR